MRPDVEVLASHAESSRFNRLDGTFLYEAAAAGTKLGIRHSGDQERSSPHPGLFLQLRVGLRAGSFFKQYRAEPAATLGRRAQARGSVSVPLCEPVAEFLLGFADAGGAFL
jgi:hypothetical protein